MVLAAALLFGAPALAQTTAAPSAPALDPATQTPGRLAAAHDLLQFALVEGGTLDTAVQQSFVNVRPQMRTSLQAQACFTAATPAHQQAVNAYIDGLPAVFRAEMGRRVPAAIDSVTPQTAAMFSEDNARGIIAFLRTDAGRRLMHHGAAEGADRATHGSGVPENDAADQQAESAWEATPSGSAFLAHASEFSSLIQGAMQRSFADVGPLMRARTQHDICAAMENECPPSMQQQAGTTP